MAASLLRECLLLLHWLLLHHGSFSESCRPLLHMYDQVIPAVRDTLRKIPELSESEGTKTHTDTHTHTQCFVKLNALKNQTAALQLRQVENYFSDQRRPNICSQKSAGFHFSQTQLESFFFL